MSEKLQPGDEAFDETEGHMPPVRRSALPAQEKQDDGDEDTEGHAGTFRV